MSALKEDPKVALPNELEVATGKDDTAGQTDVSFSVNLYALKLYLEIVFQWNTSICMHIYFIYHDRPIYIKIIVYYSLFIVCVNSLSPFSFKIVLTLHVFIALSI